MAETMKALSLRAHEKNLELAYLIDAKVPDTLRGDGGRLRQVLTNLVGNAIKFTAKGEVVVRVTLEGEEDGRLTLHFSVRDTGIGVPEDKFASIFEPFRQADGSTTRNYGGTGLGLAISSRLVALMDGRIWLESAVNQGSVFHFTGRFSKTRIVARHDESALKELAGVPLLIVDDNPTSGRILAEMTANWGMLPSGADNGDVALDAIQRAIAENSAFRIVVIDSRMPGVDGFELAERIQQMPRLKSTIIMMMVLAGPGGEAERCRRLGIPVYLLKPIRKADMLDAIQWVLGSTSNRRASHANETDVNRQFARSLRILVAEDNPVNEAVATRMLQKMGHTVSIAHNGQEAVSMTGNNGFDIVLMDVQMPVMDGFTAIQTIRNREMSAGLHLPIVAVTAHAMKGDQDRCIAAGADAYLPKPISGKRLAEVIARLIPDSGCPQGDSLMALPASSQVWDRTKALAHLDGDEVLLSELLDVFLEEAPKQIGAMRRAIADGDVSALEKAAHTLKGELGYFGLEETAAKARSIEDFAHQGELKGLTSIFQAFEAELSTSCAAMRDSQGVSHYRFSNSTEV
jgi:CheY-like chemotaxis protein/HPt (histidine-containing phosphotransfer) domain-containing protein